MQSLKKKKELRAKLTIIKYFDKKNFSEISRPELKQFLITGEYVQKKSFLLTTTMRGRGVSGNVDTIWNDLTLKNKL